MSYFISYSRRDEQAVQILAADLERTRTSIWMDREIGGGEDWWLEILSQIRGAAVFVLAVSTNSLRSRPCIAEFEYAKALGLPILPVQIGDVDSFRMTPIAEKQVLDYRARIATAPDARGLAEPAIDLVVAATGLESQRQPLPDPLPAGPPIPFEYLMQLRLAIDAVEIPSRVQLQVLTQLKQALRDEEDPAARRDIVDLLRRLARHPDATHRNVTEIRELLANTPDEEPVAPIPLVDQWTPTPPAEQDAVPEKPVPATPIPNTSVAPPAAPRPGAAAPGTRTGLRPLFGVGLGALGIGQFPPLIVYYVGHVFRADPATTPGQFLGWLITLLLATGIGIGLSGTAVRDGERWARPALAVSVLGALVIVSNIVWYRQWW